MRIAFKPRVARRSARVSLSIAIVVGVMFVVLLAAPLWAGKRSDELAIARQRAIVTPVPCYSPARLARGAADRVGLG